MIRRHWILLSLAAFAAMTFLSACDSNNPVSSPGSPDPGMTATSPTSGALVAQDHGGGNGNGGNGNGGNNGHNNDGDDNDDNGDDDNGGGNNGQATCPAAGNKVEIEGTIKSRGANSILVHQQGRKDFLCLVDRVTKIRKGNKTYTLTQLQNGWRVHVKGTSQANSISSVSCTATAREIKVQNTISH
jgi:hypothetical protein